MQFPHAKRGGPSTAREYVSSMDVRLRSSNSSSNYWARRYPAYPGSLHVYFQSTDGDLRVSTGSSTVFSGTVTIEHRVG